MRVILLLAVVLLSAGTPSSDAGAFDITQVSFGCSNYGSLASNNCTLKLNFSSSLNPVVTVYLPADFSNVSCTNCSITSNAGSTLKYTGVAVLNWTAVNPVVNGTYYVELSAASTAGSTLNMDNSELTLTITPQQITASITSGNYTVGSYTSLTLNITAAAANGIASGSTLQLNMPKNAINEVPYQTPYTCYNVTNGSSTNLSCSYSSILSNLDFGKVLPQATTLLLRLDNFRMPSSTEPYTIRGYLAYNTQGVYATFTCVLTATTTSNTASLSLPSYVAQASTTSTSDVNLVLGMYCTSTTNVILTYDKSLAVTATNASNTVANTSAFTITFSGLTCTSGKYLTLPKLSIVNPSVAKTVSFSVATFYNTTGTAYYIEKGTYIITLRANPLNYLTASLSNLAVSATGVSLTLNFSTFSPLANKDSTTLSYYLITLDSSYVTTYIQCFDLQLNSIVYCQSYNNQSNIIKIEVGTKPAGTVFVVRLDNLTNPRYLDTNASTAYNVSTYSYSVDAFYQADSAVSYIALSPKLLSPTLTTSNSTVGARANITVNLASDVLSGDTLKFMLNDSSAAPTVVSSGAGSNTNFTFVGGYWQYAASGTLSNLSFRFARTNPAMVVATELLPSITIGNGVKMNAQTNSSLLYPATTTPAELSMNASTTLTTTGASTQTTLTLRFSVAYASGDLLVLTFPNAYCTSNLQVAGGSGFQPSLPTTINSTKVTISLQFSDAFSTSNSYTLTVKYQNSYNAGTFVLAYSTFTSAGAAKESHTGSYVLTASSATVTTSSIQLSSNQSLKVEVQYPFAVTNGSSVTLELSTASISFNITGCTSLTSGSCTQTGSNTYAVAGVNTSQPSVVLLNCSFGYFTSDSLAVLTRVANVLSTNTSQLLKPFCDMSCWTCDSTVPTKCSSCFPNGVGPQLPFYNAAEMKCYASCPFGTFTSDGQCLQCDSSCATCSSANVCLTCHTDYVKSTDTGLCLLNCTAECKTCAVSKSNCTSCYSNTILYKNQCLQECPSGTSIDTASNSCLESKLAYFPFLVAAVVVMLLAAGSKLIEPTTDVVTTCVAALGLMEVGCLVALLASSGKVFTQALIIGLLALAVQLIINFVGLVLYLLFLRKDEQFQSWMKASVKNTISAYVLLVLSTLTSFKLFRMVYSRLLGREYFWAKFTSRDAVIPITNILSGVHLALFSMLAVAMGALLLFNKDVKLSTEPQIFLYSIEIVVLELLGVIVVLLDVKKPADYFEERAIKPAGIVNEGEQVANPTITLQNIVSLPNIEEVSEDALIKSPKANGPLKNRSSANNKSNLSGKRNTLSSTKSVKDKPKSVERNRCSRSPQNKTALSSRISPGKEQPSRAQGKDAPPVGSLPVLIKQSGVDDVMLDIPLSKEGSDGVAPFPNENQNIANSPDFDGSTVNNRRLKTGESGAAATEINHTVRLEPHLKDIDVSGFRKTTEIKAGQRLEVPLPRKQRPNPKINDLFLGFLNDEHEQPPKSKSREKARRSSRDKKELTQANRTTEAFNLSRPVTEEDGISASSQFRTRFDPLYEFSNDQFSEGGPPEKKTQEVLKPEFVSKEPKQKQHGRQKMKKTKDIYLQNNLSYGRRGSEN